jgi:hypothetical protein
VRLLALWLVCFGAYAATLGTNAVRGSDYAGHEPHHLLAAASIADDGDVDLTNQYATRAYAGFHRGVLQSSGKPIRGRLHEPEGIGFALLIAPAYALGGPKAVELWLAAIAALGFVLAARLGRFLVPEPWASTGALLVGLSPPALGYAATVAPELTAGALLAGGALCALSLRERARAGAALGGAALIAALPWLGPQFLVPAVPVAVVLVRWTLRARRRLVALLAGELVLASLVFYVSLNDVLYGGVTPYAAARGGAPTGAELPLGYVERAPRLVALWLDRDAGLLRWAPVLALAFFAAWLLWRSRRDYLARAVPARAEAELAAGLLLAVCAGALLVAAFAAPTLRGPWFPGRHLVPALPCAAALVGWGLRHAPRTGAALGALTLLASGWLLVQVWTGRAGWSPPASRAPLGPLADALPRYGTGSVWAAVVAAALAAVLAAVVAREWRDRSAA